MRFAVRAAFSVGTLLPVLESYRRGFGYWRVDFTTIFEDYVAGALLLVSAWGALRQQPWGRDGLVAAWAWVMGMVTMSLVSQLEATLRQGMPEPNNALVIGVKATLFTVSACALASALRSRHGAAGSGLPPPLP